MVASCEVIEPPVRLEDDLVNVAGLFREALFEQRLGVGGVRAGQAEGVRVGRAGRVGDRVDRDEENDPGAQHEPAATDTKASEGFQGKFS